MQYASYKENMLSLLLMFKDTVIVHFFLCFRFIELKNLFIVTIIMVRAVSSSKPGRKVVVSLVISQYSDLFP